MQLTNIARDVGEDARNQRLYLPRAWLEEENIDPDQWLKNPIFNDGILRVNQRLIQYADDLYKRSAYGFSGLPRNCRSAIAAASLIYSEIGRQIERQGMDSITRRAVVSKKRKVLLLLKSLGAVIYSAKLTQKLDAIPAIQFLVSAVEPEEQYAHYSGSVEDRLIWVVSLLEKVEHRKIDSYQAFARH
jgi:phytoene synthase